MVFQDTWTQKTQKKVKIQNFYLKLFNETPRHDIRGTVHTAPLFTSNWGKVNLHQGGNVLINHTTCDTSPDSHSENDCRVPPLGLPAEKHMQP